jgi:anaerobic ribonucleoside-triphosphate reductase activating protein
VLRVDRRPSPPLLSVDSGPGRRWILHLQGCARPCTDQCINPSLLDSRGGAEVSIEELTLIADLLVAGMHGPVEGLTVLGGEPTDQAEALFPLLAHVRAIGLSVMLYTGRTRAWLERPENAHARRLLDETDLLVAEPFLPSQVDPQLRWRGSRNQIVERLTARYTEEQLLEAMDRRGVTITLAPTGLVRISGLQQNAAARAVQAALSRKGGGGT